MNFTLFIRLLHMTVMFAQPAIFGYLTGRWTKRGNTFFSIRVVPEFPASNAAQAIMRAFRLRVWTWAGLLALLAALAPGDLITQSTWFGVVWLVSPFGYYFFWFRANRRVRESAAPVPPPSHRTAQLAPPGYRLDLILELSEWAGMLLPWLVPLAAVVRTYENDKLQPRLFLSVAAGFLARTCSMAYATEPAPRTGRTILSAVAGTAPIVGLTVWMVFFTMVLQPSVLSLIPPSRLYFCGVFLGYAPMYVALFRLRAWLKRNAEPNLDPMPDSCWKWGRYYFNPADPALVVPLRSGIGGSPNFARPSVWIAWLAVALVTVFGLIDSILLLNSLRRF